MLNHSRYILVREHLELFSKNSEGFLEWISRDQSECTFGEEGGSGLQNMLGLGVGGPWRIFFDGVRALGVIELGSPPAFLGVAD